MFLIASRGKYIFLFPTLSKLGVWPTLPPIQQIQVFIYLVSLYPKMATIGYILDLKLITSLYHASFRTELMILNPKVLIMAHF